VTGVSLIALALCLISASAAKAADAGSESATDKAKIESRSADGKADAPDVEARKPARDPFTYGAREDAGYVSVANANIPNGIQLLGVVVMKGEKPIAAIRVPGAQDVLFVTEGTVVQVVAPASEDKKKSTSEPLYIFINRITSDEVEVSPRTRPEDKRILR
jgi:hypothetical protein